MTGISGGHRYHRRLVAAGVAAGFDISTVRPRIRRRMPSADVVVVDSLYAWTVAGAVGRGGPRTVALVHQCPGGLDGSAPMRWLRRRLDLAVYRRCDLIVAPGRAVADRLIGRYGVAPARIEIVSPGSDLPSGPSRGPLRAGRRLGLLNVANWLPNKGILDLLDAVALLPPGHATLHLAGRTDVAPRYGRRVRERISRPDLVDRVVVHGPVAAVEVAALYEAADVFAFPSRVEAYGSAAGEAMAAGLPIVGWDNPHLRALVDDGVEGLLVEPGNREELASAIERLATKPADLDRLADGARRGGSRLPTWHDTTSRFLALLTGLVTEPVEPPQHRVTSGDIEATHGCILDEGALGGRHGDIERPADRGFDRADVGDDDDD